MLPNILTQEKCFSQNNGQMRQRKRFIPFKKIATGGWRLKDGGWRKEAEGPMSYKIDYFLSNPLHVTQISTEVLNKTPPPATSGLEVDTAFLILINTQRSHTALATHLQAPVRILFSFLLPLWSSVGDFTSHQWHLWRTLETLNVPRGRPPF